MQALTVALVGEGEYEGLAGGVRTGGPAGAPTPPGVLLLCSSRASSSESPCDLPAASMKFSRHGVVAVLGVSAG